eukprot:g3936.t1
MGIILFLRFGWGVGQAGVLGVLAVLAIAFTLATLTVLSFSTIVTNGNMEGGGSYFMISRSLGPEFGGAIGLLFYLAYAVGVCFYIIGFATEVQTTWFPAASGVMARWIVTGVGSGGLFVCLLISVVGAEAFARFNTWFFLIQFAAIFIGMGSMWFTDKDLYNGGHNTTDRHGHLAPARVYGFSAERLERNLWPEWSNEHSGIKDVDEMCGGGLCNFQFVFSVLFPCATGIMEGANLSGDLKDPARSIPKGTLFALGTALTTYVLLVVSMGACFDRHALKTDMTLMQDATVGSPYIVIVGIIISAISSALGSLFGGSRVLQALARDDLFPCLGFFAKGTAHGDEPRRAVVMTWAIAQACLFIGNLDIVAPVITAFFLLSYGLCNLTALALRLTGAPNFRPLWRYSTWWSSFLGFLLCIGVMFYLNAIYAAVGMAMMLCVYAFIAWRAPVKAWGDVSQALLYHQVRKWLLRMDQQNEGVMHAKYWRPSVLLFADHMRTDLVEFCDGLKKGGLLVVGNVVVGSVPHYAETARRLQASWLAYIQRHKVKAFPQVLVAPTLRSGHQFLLQGSGLGGLRCNTLAVPLYDTRLASEAADFGNNVASQRNVSFYDDVADELRRGDCDQPTALAPQAINPAASPISSPAMARK